MKSNLIEFPSNIFVYCKRSNCLIIDVSDMECNHLQFLYDDERNDVGFAVKSSKTGNVVIFYLVNVLADDEDFTEVWEYELTDKSACEYPQCGKMTARVFNTFHRIEKW